MNQILLALAALVVALVVIYWVATIVGWFVYLPHAVKIFKTPLHLTIPPHQPLPGGRDTWFTAADGAKLRGTHLPTPARQRRGLVIYGHGFCGNRWNATPYISNLLERGFDVFTFDFRGHGESPSHGRYRPLQWVTQHEIVDLKAAIDCAYEMCDDQTVRAGVIGSSRGAVAALCLAGDDNRIDAIVADGSFSTDAIQCHFMRRYMSIYSRLAFVWERISDIGLFSYRIGPRLLAGITQHCRYLNVERRLRRVRQPVFMIHGTRDSFVPLTVVQKMRSLISGRAKLWLVDGAKHNAAITLATDEYERRVEKFFRRHLSREQVTVVHEFSPRTSRPLRPATVDVTT